MKQIQKETMQSSTTLTLQDALGKAISKEQALALVQSDDLAYKKYLSFPESDRNDILGFIAGQHGLKITYDSFFQSILSPQMHPRRVESLLSAIFEEEVHIKEVLPREGNQMAEDGSLIIMDILLELSNGSYINVEMQKYGYLFPGERSDCYAADFIMRQYNKLKDEKKKNFSYKDMKPFYIIVLMATSSSAFLDVAPEYIHNEQVVYDSGAKITSLSHIKYISLDTFHATVHNINNRLDAWLTFLSSDKPADIISLINIYPEFRQLYQEIAEFRTKPKELIHMYSEALAIADKNTVRLMIDEMQEQLTSLNAEVADTKVTLAKQYETISDQNITIAKQGATITEQNATIARQDATIASQDATIANQDATIADKDATIADKDAENARLRQKLIAAGINPDEN